jgi:UDP-N-acetylglucosamine 2-epimerase (non-hydrolysing)
MSKKKYLLVFGTRPEAIKMMPVLRALDDGMSADCVVCVTGQHEELINTVLPLFGITPHYQLQVMSHNQQLAGLTARLLSKLETVLLAEKPDWVLVQGDTNSAMAGGLAAFYQRIPVGHVEAGIRSHNNAEPFPEEINRKIIDVASTLHFAPTMLDKYDLIREGYSSHTIHVTGNTGIDALAYVSALPFSTKGTHLESLPLEKKRILLTTVHRRENHGAPLEAICDAVRTVAWRYRDTVHVVLPVHPNPNVSGTVRRRLGGVSNITLTPPLVYQELIAVAKASFFVLTDSGGLQEELPWLGKPALVLRNVTERREAVFAGAARLVGSNTKTIISAAAELLEDPFAYQRMAQRRSLFGDGTAAQKMARILRSYDASKVEREIAPPANLRRWESHAIHSIAV